MTIGRDVLRSALGVSLEPIRPADVMMLVAIAQNPTVAETWRFRGASVSPAAVESALWEGHILSCVIRDAASEDPVGFFGVYDANLYSRYGFISTFVAPTFQRTRTGIALYLGVEEAFDRLDLRKVYAEITKSNLTSLGPAAASYFDVEVVMPEREFQGSGRQDVVLLGVDRRQWSVRTRRVRSMLTVRSRMADS